MNFTVKQMCELLNISRSTAYNYINRACNDLDFPVKISCNGVGTELVTENNTRFRTSFLISGFAVQYIANEYLHIELTAEQDAMRSPERAESVTAGPRFSGPPALGALQSDYIDLLKAQLKVKDEQIKNLQEQLHNSQVLLLNEQKTLSLPEDMQSDVIVSSKKHRWFRKK